MRSRNSGLLGPALLSRYSQEPAGSLGLYISDAPLDLAFLYGRSDPILLESPEVTYVEWSEAKASQKSRAYITTAREKQAELHIHVCSEEGVIPCSPVRKAAGRDDIPVSPKQNAVLVRY
jgi:hypothetical protein